MVLLQNVVMYTADDKRIVQFLSAAMPAAGLLAVWSARAVFSSNVTIGQVSRRNAVSWSPKAFGGQKGRSPLIGAMWVLIFSSQFLFSATILYNTLVQNEFTTDVSSLFNQCALTAAALLVASVWEPVFLIERPWSFVLASVLLTTTASMATIAAVVADPFLQDNWYLVFGGVSATIFSGWTIVAAGLSVGIVTRVYNRGVGTREVDVDDTTSLWPLVLAIVTAVLSIAFSNPIFCVPLLATLFFVQGVATSWRIWAAVGVCVVGIVLGVLIVVL